MKEKQYLNSGNLIKIVNIELALIIAVCAMGLVLWGALRLRLSPPSFTYSNVYEGTSLDEEYRLIISKEGFTDIFGRNKYTVRFFHEKKADNSESGASETTYQTVFMTKMDSSDKGILCNVDWRDDGVEIILRGAKDRECIMLPYESSETSGS